MVNTPQSFHMMMIEEKITEFIWCGMQWTMRLRIEKITKD